MPGGTERKETRPASLVVALNSWFVAVFTALTVAPRMTAPVGSVTVAEIEPVAIPCEKAGTASNRHAMPASNQSESCKGRSAHFTWEVLSEKRLAVANKFIFNLPPSKFVLRDGNGQTTGRQVEALQGAFQSMVYVTLD